MKYLFLVALLAGCASTTKDFTTTPGKGVTPPDSGRAVVHFLLEDEGFDEGLVVYEGEKDIGVLTGGSYFARQVDPGVHEYRVNTGLFDASRESVTISAEAGESFFVRYSPGGYQVVANLELVSEDVARQEIRLLDYID